MIVFVGWKTMGLYALLAACYIECIEIDVAAKSGPPKVGPRVILNNAARQSFCDQYVQVIKHYMASLSGTGG